MRLFWELAKLSFRRQMTYRAATLAGLLTNFFFGLLRAAIFVALFANRGQVAGISLPEAITYTALTQASIGYLSAFSWYDLMRSVYTGDVASDLLKPMGYFNFWLAQDLGRAAANFITRGLTLMLAYAVTIGITLPTSFNHWLALSLVIILSWLVSFAWRFNVNLVAFWFPNGVGFGRFFFMASLFFSGFLMPLRFFPPWVERLAYFTPFPHTFNTLVEVYLGVLDGTQMVWAIAAQAAWAFGLIALAHLILRSGVRRLVILGG